MSSLVKWLILVHVVGASCRQWKSALPCWISVTVSCNIHIDVTWNWQMTLISQPSMSCYQAPQLTASTLSSTQVHSPRSVSFYQFMLQAAFVLVLQLVKGMSSHTVDLVVCANPSSSWVWVGGCFFWYRLTRVVLDKGPLTSWVHAARQGLW